MDDNQLREIETMKCDLCGKPAKFRHVARNRMALPVGARVAWTFCKKHSVENVEFMYRREAIK